MTNTSTIDLCKDNPSTCPYKHTHRSTSVRLRSEEIGHLYAPADEQGGGLASRVDKCQTDGHSQSDTSDISVQYLHSSEGQQGQRAAQTGCLQARRLGSPGPQSPAPALMSNQVCSSHRQPLIIFFLPYVTFAMTHDMTVL